ncbi:MAG: N-6 DNA methylase, partial [Candidatus Methanoplasma sp.]|nr:N-6 DNA methylase [Candidatus Methanoplasma sp.]
MLDEIDAKDGLKDIDLNEFYRSVEGTLTKIDTADGKQKVVTSLYEKFFKVAFPKDQSINGVVYTPQEIVDFILRSAAGILKQEFGLDISGENVNILDPFTGTGTFVARLMETGLIRKEDLERKYTDELFANEITLLAYYIAAVNIENVFAKILEPSEYRPFDHILLTDTFNIEEICKGRQTTIGEEDYFKRNLDRIKAENGTPITIIVGNPPYGATQKSANDDAKKRTYRDGVDGGIEKKYLDAALFDGKKGNVNSVYDNYVRAFRWSTDRIGGSDGIVAFVTPNGWLSGSAFVGFRKCLEKEFSKIYVFNLRGDATTQGEMRRQEGDGVFGEGSRTGISITLLVKRKGFSGKAKVLYAKTEDCMKKKEKFDLLIKNGSFSDMERNDLLEVLKTKDNGDWIVQRDERFQKLIPLAGDTHKKFDKHEEETIFVGYTRGFGTCRDAWSYNFSKESVSKNMQNMIEEYNRQKESGKVEYDTKKIAWDQNLLRDHKSKKNLVCDCGSIAPARYRPFD